MTTSTSKIRPVSRLLLFLSAALLVISLFLPIWRIDLDAPQYPEGLNLLIYADKLGGNVEIINGLNHYIGMKTLHTDDFIEFKVLPYCILFFAAFSLLSMALGTKRILYVLLSLFILFGVVSMIDFWRWEYNYGHNLDPNAAIIVPGMAYQPPLIGFKQLLNFGAYSIPDKGGWLFILSGVCMLLATLLETGILNKFGKKKGITTAAFAALVFGVSCSSAGPEPISLNKDNCDYCKMTISDSRFATELKTDKGRVYKFDDMSCMLNYKKENSNAGSATYYVSDYLSPNALLVADSLFYISGDALASPMGGNVAAFSNPDSAQVYAMRFSAQPLTWSMLSQ
ncbi:MAG: nitrous oxide reductase accessory protein NosL [Bacteroidia bacterium]|nr:nitrous oxide reductase accessory protein NosL [Bacteroidia bacterium]